MGSGWQVLWLVSVLGMSGAMVYQLVRLTTVFFSWPVKTTVNLAFRWAPGSAA